MKNSFKKFIVALTRTAQGVMFPNHFPPPPKPQLCSLGICLPSQRGGGGGEEEGGGGGGEEEEEEEEGRRRGEEGRRRGEERKRKGRGEKE